MISGTSKTFFAPQLFIANGVKDISFYKRAFGAVEQLVLTNDDGSIHVAELSIDGAIFHLHEVTARDYFTPGEHQGTTVLVGLFVDNVGEVMFNAVKAGAIEISPLRDYEYGYRQGKIKDPFGHLWMIQKKVSS
ncbi:MAG TPA: VOC family protein [Puia sp.]|nr:VOC family protein [Puia sp.]